MDGHRFNLRSGKLELVDLLEAVSEHFRCRYLIAQDDWEHGYSVFQVFDPRTLEQIDTAHLVLDREFVAHVHYPGYADEQYPALHEYMEQKMRAGQLTGEREMRLAYAIGIRRAQPDTTATA